MEAWENLAHQITLLAIDPERAVVRKMSQLGAATAAAVLAELVLQERARKVAGKIQIRDSRPTDDPMVDLMLSDLATRPARYPDKIISGAKDDFRDRALDELVSNGWAALIPSGKLTADRYRLITDDKLDAARKLAIGGLNDPKAGPARAVCLAGLASILGLDSDLLPEMGLRSRRRIRAELLERSWLLRELQSQFLVTTPTQHPGRMLRPVLNTHD